jgi:hypothetical protein
MRFSPLEAGYGPRVKEAIMQPRHRLQQRDLFEEDRKTPDIPASRRGILVPLIRGLLVEALSVASVASAQTKEAAHEQDHA